MNEKSIWINHAVWGAAEHKSDDRYFDKEGEMRLVRDNSKGVTFYNEGLVVFLYDEGYTDRIQQTNPTILEGFGEDDAADPKLAELAAAGVLVVFELQGDGDVAMELAMGDPLTKDEIAEGGWSLPVQQARLHLPSGTLRIECYNNLQFDPYTEEGEAGAVVPVPPGDYAVSLYHRSVWADEEEADDPDQGYAWQVIVLTPSKGSQVDVASPMLRFPSDVS